MRWLKSKIVLILGILVLVYTFVPIFIVVMMSFNKLPSEQSKIYKFNTFTLDNWLHPCADPSMCDGLWLSIRIGFFATLGATILGTLAAFALVRRDFVGRSTTNILIFLPMAAPEIVLGSSLLALFVNANLAGQLGFWTIFIAHVMFIISFVVVTVKARLIGFDRHLEEAAMDLGANELTTFLKVTLPLIAPAMLAAALLGFALSIDDFVVTYLNAGATQTFPIFVWGIARVAVPPQVNVVASAIFLVAIAIGVGNVIWQHRQARQTRRPA
jgi:spermidine/putrescine transport system permease protein